MDKVKTAVKCAGVAAAYLLLLMFSKLLEFWIFTSKVTYEELLNQTWNWEAMPESFLFTFPYGLGIFRVLLITLLLCLLIHGRDSGSGEKNLYYNVFECMRERSFCRGCADRGGHRSLLCKTGYSLVDAAF